MKRNFLASLIIVLLALFTIGCGHLFYYPTQTMYVDAQKLTPLPEQIEIAGPEGKIIGWLFKPEGKKPKATLLFFHGNAENISSHFTSLFWILKHDYAFLIFDYPGFGGSEGTPTQKSTTESGEAAYQWLRQHKNDLGPIAFFGQSLGGNIAMYTAAAHAPELCLVIVESTFKSYKSVGRRVMAHHPLTWIFQPLSYLLIRDQYSADDRIGKIAPTPLLVVHSKEDSIVHFENGEDVYEAALKPKEFWQLPTGKHIQAFSGGDSNPLRLRLIEQLQAHCR